MNTTTVLAVAPASYAAHIAAMTRRYEDALHQFKLQAIVLAAGERLPLFLDDQHYPHKPNPHLLQWLPLFGLPDSWLIIESDKNPRLVVLAAADFWHAEPELPDESYLEHFQVEVYREPNALEKALGSLPRRHAIIDPTDSDKRSNPKNLLNFLNFYRSIKTPYEVDCISAATDIAIPAHIAAENAFNHGASGFDIHIAFLAAAGCSEHELPYPDIIACNENGATLHYEKRTHDREPHSLLIDAGTAINGYACDITRTYSKSADFHELIVSVDTLQQKLCDEIGPGMSFGDAQTNAHLGIAAILKEHGIVNMALEHMVAEGVTSAFFPHGLGHMLGLQVHDVGGHMADTSGKTAPPPEEHPHLRMSRTLEHGMVLTIEPGLYFIPMLLERLKTASIADKINWAAVNMLAPCGGIRIEDNVVVTETGASNITRSCIQG